MKVTIGQRFGHLTVIGHGPDKFYGKAHVRTRTSICRCDCGKTIVALNDSLVRKHRVKCSSKCRLTFRGRYISSNGYVCVYAPGHPYATKRGYVYEHRLIMEKNIGRYLLPTEDVHHKDSNRQNNQSDNLLLLSRHAHHRLHREEQLKGHQRKKAFCPICHTKVTREGCWCRKCRLEAHNTSRGYPDIDTMWEMCEKLGFEEVARRCHVSGTAIRKKLKKAKGNLPLTKWSHREKDT